MAKIKMTVLIDDELKNVASKIIASQGMTMSGKVSLALFAEVVEYGRQQGMDYSETVETYLPNLSKRNLVRAPWEKKVSK